MLRIPNQASCWWTTPRKILIQAIYSGLYATFFYMKACYPYLKESKGSVVNFASGAGIVGKVGQSSYAAAKEGIRGLSRVAAAEWGPGWRPGQHCRPSCHDQESGAVERSLPRFV